MVVTGTSKGIGRGIADHYLARGYAVAGCSRGPGTIETGEYFHSEVDVTNDQQVRVWIQSVRKRFERIDVLVCNAGMSPPPTLLTMTSTAVLQTVMSVNVTGTFATCREVAKVMMRQRSGRIVTMSSMKVALNDEGASAYAMSKSAIVQMTRVLAKELATVGITCNAVSPSVHPTDMLHMLGDVGAQRTLDQLTIKRLVTVEEICNVISFFISPESACITGQVIQMGLVA